MFEACLKLHANPNRPAVPCGFILPSSVGCNCPNPARLFDGAFSFHFGFSTAVEGSPVAPRRSWAKANKPSARTMLRPGIEACSKRALLPEVRSFDDKFDAVAAPYAEQRRAA
jgi:hypothetical protein